MWTHIDTKKRLANLSVARNSKIASMQSSHVLVEPFLGIFSKTIPGAAHEFALALIDVCSFSYYIIRYLL